MSDLGIIGLGRMVRLVVSDVDGMLVQPDKSLAPAATAEAGWSTVSVDNAFAEAQAVDTIILPRAHA